ncbi:hypothetical protein OIU84_029805 [Salix udensis]|uniref:Uncharacterized protein n=1 Tax=Salix udensis TaxID=889485 RepID=A0AAD6KA47_9ROSI|nr:hypothetical protein OIU84_029805 [Salix udensis]
MSASCALSFLISSSLQQAWKHFQSSTVQEIIDKSMEIEDAEEIQRVVQIGLLCTQESPNLRPTMTEVVQMLRREEVGLPSPSKPPFTDELMELNYLGSFDRHHPSGLSALQLATILK